MSNFLKFTLTKDDKKQTPKMSDNSKGYKSVNMYMNSNKSSENKWNLDQVVDKSCTIVDQLTDLDKSIIKILESKYHAEKILTDDLFEFMVQMMTSEYMNHKNLNLKKKIIVKDNVGKQTNGLKVDENQILIELETILTKIQSTQLKELKNFVKLFHEKFLKALKAIQKNKNKEQIKEFDKIIQTYSKKPGNVKFIQQNGNKLDAKKKYLQSKQNKLKNMKNKSKQSLGTLGSKQAHSGSRNLSGNKIQQTGSLFKLLNKQTQKKVVKEQKYDYSAIISGSLMNIKLRSSTNTTEEIKQPMPQSKHQKTKNDGFVFFRPKKGVAGTKKN